MTVSDVGTELNPLQVVSQDEGAAIMGLGHSQMEQLLLDEHGRIRNLGALDYRIPTFKDVPLELVSAAVENHDGPGPYGSKGISEGALLCTAGALGAAVADADRRRRSATSRSPRSGCGRRCRSERPTP